jgi:RNA polymerase sigma factor (sigma-70 family)
MNEVIQNLRRAALLREGAGLTDGQLLKDYVKRREEAALAALVHRHGPMVWGVCRRVLRNDHDAEDAFQATFLVLVRKAGSIASPELLANWLYGVAHQTALKARATSAKRKVRESQVVEMPEPAVTERDLWNDLLPLLDHELSRLPDKYRVAIVLCELEGKTRKEAARQLGVPEGTLAARVARGRGMLAKRLARHGPAVSGGALAVVLSQNVASAGVPNSVVSSTIQAASLFATGQTGAISVKVAALTEGVLKAMFLTKLKIATAVLLAVVAAMVGVALATFQTQAAQQPQPAKVERRAPQDEGKPKAEPKPVVVQEDAQIRQLAWSANGKILATIGIVYETVAFTDADGKPTDSGGVIPHSTIKLWDATTGKLKRSLGEEKDTYIAAIAFSADGKTAAVSTSKHVLTKQPNNPIRCETEVRVMDAETWALKHKVKTDGFASALAFSRDGMCLALGGNRNHIAFVRLWDVQKQKMMGGTEGGGYRVHCLAFSIGGKQLAAGDENGKVRVFDGQTGAARPDFEGHGPLRSGGEQCVTGVGFSPDGKTLVSGSVDKTLKLWDVEAGKLVRTLEGNKGPVTALAFSPDGEHFATAGGVTVNDQWKVEVILWDAKTGKPKKLFPEQTKPVSWLAFSPDGRTLAIGAGAGFNSRFNKGYGRAYTPGEFKLWKLQ